MHGSMCITDMFVIYETINKFKLSFLIIYMICFEFSDYNNYYFSTTHFKLEMLMQQLAVKAIILRYNYVLILVSLTASKEISAPLEGSGSNFLVAHDKPLHYGKVPRQAALDRKVYIIFRLNY